MKWKLKIWYWVINLHVWTFNYWFMDKIYWFSKIEFWLNSDSGSTVGHADRFKYFVAKWFSTALELESVVATGVGSTTLIQSSILSCSCLLHSPAGIGLHGERSIHPSIKWLNGAKLLMHRYICHSFDVKKFPISKLLEWMSIRYVSFE